MRSGRRYVKRRLAPITAALSALTMLAGVFAAIEARHPAHAAESAPRTSAASPPGARPTAEELAGRRAGSLRRTATQVELALRDLQLKAHNNTEQEQAAAIQSEVTRLKNLSIFAWPTMGGVSSGFGMRKHPILGYVRLHNGADIGGACGNPIYATQSGTVTKAGYSGSSGNNIRIDHGEINGKQVETAYLHMSKLAARTGQQVTKGDVIGYVGTTGLSTACHLHLALYEDGAGSDPLDYIKRA